MGWKSLRILYPSTQGMLASRMTMPLISAAFFRLQPKVSMQVDIIFSMTAMTVENDAKVINRKNSAPQTRGRLPY